MPGNGPAFEALTLCRQQYKKDWFFDDRRQVFRAYAVDHTGVYHTLKGAGLMQEEIFMTVLRLLNHFLAIDLT